MEREVPNFIFKLHTLRINSSKLLPSSKMLELLMKMPSGNGWNLRFSLGKKEAVLKQRERKKRIL